MGQPLTEIDILAELASPKKNFVSKYEREQHKKGFKYCAHLFQMLGFKPNKSFYEKIKKELQPKKTKVKVKKEIKIRTYQTAINKSAINL